MASIDVALNQGTDSRQNREPVVNNFSIQVGTVNGSGSQSANSVLLRTIFQMGVPVSGKNLFPSNIAGLPTWFTIRVSKDGYVARKRDTELLVAMNPETAIDDVKALKPGAAVLYDEPLKLATLRDDLNFFAVPFDKLVAPVAPDPKLKKLLRNMIYVGVLAHLLSLEMTEVEEAISKQFSGKKRATEINVAAARAGYEYAAANLSSSRFKVERMNENAGKIIIDGNSAGALGALFAGVTVVPWYPITPSSSLIEALSDYLKEYRVDADGKASFAVVQAEDELAAIGMVLGASWSGARAMTASSGPGISLMTEFTGLGYYVEIPAVIWDVQRVGPSTGLPTRTAQGDLLSTAFLSHGDTKHPLLLPASCAECFEFGGAAFDIAERLQTPVFVMSDLDIGMNNWVSDPFPYPEKPLDRGKVLSKEELDRLGSFARYKDVDGDGIGYRTLPGTLHPNAAWFARGSGHNEKAQYSERPDDYVNNLDRLDRKWETARTIVPGPVLEHSAPGAKVGVIAFGSSHWAMVETVDQLKEQGIEADYLRVRAYPFNAAVHEFIAAHERVYVVDQNRDGQMLQLIKMDIASEDVVKLRSVRHYNGHPLDARFVTDSILSQEQEQK
ncbi:MAG TPA: 2-oxoacid:acceptor oxidoreductase subunit alpha [Candidatus Saccharimonadales bacterium]|nr:2-oxoacid:acceptor oxidoreductase subunit alpha [Candidatus Saccharimonadales bacterium]